MGWDGMKWNGVEWDGMNGIPLYPNTTETEILVLKTFRLTLEE